MPRGRKPTVELTDKQREIYKFIAEAIDEKGYPPSIREIGDHFGIKSTNGVFDHLRALQQKGYIKRDFFTSRSIVLTKGLDNRPTPMMEAQRRQQVPLLGEAAGGTPITSFDEANRYLIMDKDLLPKKSDKVFAVKVRGDSMVDAGISDGDVVFVQKQQQLKRGDIGVVRVKDEVTVKYYFHEGTKIVLKPANRSFKQTTIKESDFEEVQVMGKVVSILHNI